MLGGSGLKQGTRPAKDKLQRCVVWYGMVNVNLYSALTQSLKCAEHAIEKPAGFQALSKGPIVLLCAEVVRQGVPDHRAVHSECSAANSG